MTKKQWISNNIWIWSLLGVVLLWIGVSLLQKQASVSYLVSNICTSCFLCIMALGQMMVMTSGDGAIDLSSQYVLSLVPYIMQFFSEKYGLIPALIISLSICAVIGLVNGMINIYLKVPAMITTLATGYIIFSVTLILSKTIAGVPDKIIKNIAQSAVWLGIPSRIVIILFFATLMYILMYKTKYGWNLHAVGQNRMAAGLSGINVNRTVIIAFIIDAVLCGISGVLINGYIGLGGQDIGSSYIMPCIIVTVVGGTGLAGGKSSVIGIVLASIMWTMLNAFLNLTWLGVPYQNLLKGLILVLVLIASAPKQQTNL